MKAFLWKGYNYPSAIFVPLNGMRLVKVLVNYNFAKVTKDKKTFALLCFGPVQHNHGRVHHIL